MRRWRNVFLAVMVLLVLALGSMLYCLNSLDDEGVAALTPRTNHMTNVLIMGIDGGVLEGGEHMVGRSDVMILVSLDSKQNQGLMMSLPRDTLVRLDEYGDVKLNAAHVYGGVELTVATVEDIIDRPLHYFLKVDFTGFRAVVDAAGGIWLDVEKPMHYSDPYATPPLVIDLEPGWQHLDGDKAEQYVRYRDEMGDIGRVDQQKKAILALLHQLTDPLNAWRLPSVAHEVQKYVHTNMSAHDIISLALNYMHLHEPLQLETMPGWGSNDGAYWIADTEALETLLNSVSMPSSGQENSLFQEAWELPMFQQETEPSREDTRLIVLNGNGVAGAATEVAEWLADDEFCIVDIGDADRYDYLQSMIIYNDGAEAKAKLLAKTLPAADVVPAKQDNSDCDVVVIVGSAPGR